MGTRNLELIKGRLFVPQDSLYVDFDTLQINLDGSVEWTRDGEKFSAPAVERIQLRGEAFIPSRKT